jgi:hypothetical protein
MNNIIEFLLGIIVGNLNKLPKGFGRKIQLNAITLSPMTHGRLIFNIFLIIILNTY